MMAASDRWYVTFRGTGGHGGAGAHFATDVTILQAQFLLSLQTIVSRNVSSLDSAVISVGAIESGSFGSVNVMPDKIRIGGTARSLTSSIRNTIERRMKELANGLATSFGCTAEVEYIRVGVPLVNHEENMKRAIKAAQAVVGEANVNQNIQPSMGGEDFAFMLLERPGAFIFLGINKDETKRGPLHSPNYNFNDEAIPFGVAYWITLVQQQLKD
jgi:hippurate hydrolase